MITSPSPNIQSEYISEIGSSSGLLEFVGDAQRDVYNITAPFEYQDLSLIAGREETRAAPLKSRVGFYAEQDGRWHKVSELEDPACELEDPFVTFIDDRLIVGAVKVDWQTNPLVFKTVFYEATSLDTMHPIAEGPVGMKDIRLKQLDDGQILVMTRPDFSTPDKIDRQIGWFKINDLTELNANNISRNAFMFSGMFAEGEWGGVNEVHIIDDNWVGLLSHKAYKDAAGGLHYTATVFELNHQTGESTPMRELSCRNDFPACPAKTEFLEDVIFSGGLVRHGNGQATWYGGLSDAAAGFKTLDDPFRLPEDAFFPTAA